jgi:ribose 1,5-bisphosphokinase
MNAARLVYVMGASGVGKDSVLSYARARLAGTDILFAHRYITREPFDGDENFIALSPKEFSARRERGLFAFAWAAHGYEYGIGREIEEWLRRGATVVVSGSRAHYREGRIGDCVPVLITAPGELAAQRLAKRGREDSMARAQRLARGGEISVPGAEIIDNSGPLAIAGEALVTLLRRRRAKRAATA